MKKLILVLAGAIMLSSCKKDYENKPSPFKVNDLVKLNGVDPRKSFIPYDCCTCPCTIDSVYRDEMYYKNWFYKLHDQAGTPLIHVSNEQIKKY